MIVKRQKLLSNHPQSAAEAVTHDGKDAVEEVLEEGSIDRCPRGETK